MTLCGRYPVGLWLPRHFRLSLDTVRRELSDNTRLWFQWRNLLLACVSMFLRPHTRPHKTELFHARCNSFLLGGVAVDSTNSFPRIAPRCSSPTGSFPYESISAPFYRLRHNL